MRNIVMLLGAVFILASCNSGNESNTGETTTDYHQAISKMQPASPHEVSILETIDVGTYTYLKLNEEGKVFWAAITSRPIDKTKKYYYKDGMEMNNFTSKQLNRTFDTILFIQHFSDQPFAINTNEPEHPTQGKTTSAQDKSIHVDAPTHGVQIAELYKNKGKYQGQSVTVRGVVTKLNKMIMDKNWIHIQDGSNFEKAYDLTITSTDEIDFNLGDTVTYKGTITLNKDFGAGYFYDLIMEDAKQMN